MCSSDLSGSRASGVISTASFLSPDDSRNGSISGRISVPLGGNNSASFSLNGTLLNGNFSGLISPSDRAGSAGRFTLQKGAPLPRGQGEIGPGGGGQLREFSGSFLDRTCEGLGRSNLCRNPGPVSVPVKMAINSAPANAGFFFVNLFSDVRIVSVQLDLDGVVLPLPSCEFDQRSNSLHFQGLIQGTGGSGSQTTFDCMGRGAGYSCSYRNEAFGATYQFEVSPSKPGAIK